MGSGITNRTVVKNLIWRYTERFLAQIVTFFVSLILARILTPDEYGTVALVLVIVSMLDVFSARGFNQALIQKPNLDHLDYSSVFFVNMGINLVLYICVYFFAPYIALFYGNHDLIALLRILGIRILILGFNAIQQAYVQRNMMFKKFFFSTTIGTGISAIVGVLLAYQGAGAWAIVMQSLVNTIVDTFVLFCTIEWKPRWEFSFSRIKGLWGFGARNLLMGIIDSVYNQLRSLSIGKIYTTSDLAFYDKGKNLPAMVVDNVQISASNVFFSALSREESHDDVKKKMREYLGVMYYIMCPILCGLATVAHPIIIIMYTSKWVAAVPFLIIYCLAYLTWVPQIPMLQAINSRGRADVTLKITMINRAIGIVILILLVYQGPIYICLGELISNILITILIYIEARKMFKYRIGELINDVLQTTLVTIVMCVCIYIIQDYLEGMISKLIISVATGIIIYVVLSIILQNKNMKMIIDLMKRRQNHNG